MRLLDEQISFSPEEKRSMINSNKLVYTNCLNSDVNLGTLGN